MYVTQHHRKGYHSFNLVKTRYKILEPILVSDDNLRYQKLAWLDTWYISKISAKWQHQYQNYMVHIVKCTSMLAIHISFGSYLKPWVKFQSIGSTNDDITSTGLLYIKRTETFRKKTEYEDSSDVKKACISLVKY